MTETYQRLTLIGAGIVTFTVLVISSVHLFQVSMVAGAGWLSVLTPVAVDALGLTAAVSLWSARRNGEKASGFAVTALILSIAASVCGNALWPFLSELRPEHVQVLAAIVATYPAVALAISVELVLAAIRQEPSQPQQEVPGQSEIDRVTGSPATCLTETESVTVTEVFQPETPIDMLRRLMSERPDATSAELAQLVGRSASWVRAKRSEIRKEVAV